MATIFAHALVPIAARAGLGSVRISKQLMGTALFATMIPDLDVIAFLLGIPYGDAFGHRGFTHSIAFAGLAGLIASFIAQPLNSSKKAAFWLVFISVLSHPVLDAFTNGGLGVAFLWPLTDTRYFMPWRPIMVSPIGVSSFFEARSLRVLTSEFFWVVLPLAAFTVGALTVRRVIQGRDKP